jgi:hypothetical protein
MTGLLSWPQEKYLHNPSIEFFVQGTPNLTIQLPFEHTVQGIIYSPESEYYSFKITDLECNLIELGEINELDGIFNNDSEKFQFTITSELAYGKYILYIFDKSIEAIRSAPGTEYIGLYELTIAESDIMCYMFHF